MSNAKNYLFTKESGQMQLPFDEYKALIDRVRECVQLRHVQAAVLADLKRVLGEESPEASLAAVKPPPARKEVKVVVRRAAVAKATVEAPAIKQDIRDHFNQYDGSGRLLNVFQQYYTCLNDACGGTVRITMKDGICSIWNYDEWEEFAFMDIFEERLRIGLNPRYAVLLESLAACEPPRTLASQRKLHCVLVENLNNTMLNVLTQAFQDVGMTAS